MEFTSRGNNRAPQAMNVGSGSAAPGPHGRRKHIDWAAKTVRIELFILLVGCALLLGAVSLYLGFAGDSRGTEFKKVDTTKYQAVSLNGGVDITSGSIATPVYFGHIRSINDKYIDLQDVYYITPGQQQANQQAINAQLVKLGCQLLHSPYDQMIINKNQVAYWENLKDDGKVVVSIKDFIKQNPNGPNCNAATPTTTKP